MRIYDMHCDVLYKMLLDPSLDFSDQEQLDVTYERLHAGQIGFQAFAIFLPEDRVPTFAMVEQAVRSFERSILTRENMTFIRTQADLQTAEQEGRIGALLTLEGAEGLMGSLDYLKQAYQMGIRCLGITWNYANWAADGVLEERHTGLSLKGRKLIKACEEIGMIIDISHLNEPGFWEVLQLTNKPIIASHSNAYAIEPHPRNLTDEQIRAIIARNGRIGITFVPDFIGGKQSVDDVLRHVDHICSLGGEHHLGFGSDFDGIDDHLHRLAHPADYANLAEALHKRYTSKEAQQFLHGNWHRFFMEQLPR